MRLPSVNRNDGLIVTGLVAVFASLAVELSAAIATGVVGVILVAIGLRGASRERRKGSR